MKVECKESLSRTVTKHDTVHGVCYRGQNDRIYLRVHEYFVDLNRNELLSYSEVRGSYEFTSVNAKVVVE